MRVRDILAEHKQGFYRPGKFDTGNVHFVRISDLTDDAFLDETTTPMISVDPEIIRGFSLKKDDFLFARTGGAGRFGLIKSDIRGIFASYLIRFRFKDSYNSNFLRYFFLSDAFQCELKSHIHGGVNQNVHAENIKDCLVPEIPLAEQTRIVAILDEAFEAIDKAKQNAEKNLQNARELFESHLQSVFTQRGDGWAERRLGDVVTRLTNGYVGPTRNIYHDSGIPYLLARHVKNNRLLFDGKTFITKEFNSKNKKSMLKAGDVLLVQSGHIGHSAVVTREHDGHNCHAMIVITPVEGAFIGPFLSLFFKSSEMKRKFQEIRSGSTVPHLTCREVKELMIALPNLATQQRVVDHSQIFEAETQLLESVYRRKLAALDELKKSLLHRAFSGEL